MVHAVLARLQARRGLLVAAVFTTVISLFVYTSSAGAATPQRAPRYTAQALADAILFADGPAAARLLDTGRPQVTMTKAMLRTEQSVNAMLRQDRPFAASFASRVQSGDRTQVAAALGELGARVHVILNQQYGAAKVDRDVRTSAAAIATAGAKAKSAAPDSGTVNVNQTINVNYFYAAAALYGAVAVLILLVLVCPPCVASPVGGPNADSQLAVDEFVNGVAQNLRTA